MNDIQLEELRQADIAIKADYVIVQSRQARVAIASELRHIKKMIEDEERRRSAVLNKLAVKGIEIQIPRCMSEHSSLKFHVHEGILYLIDSKKLRDSKGRFHYYNYAWIPNGNKFTQLSVRILGGDGYGDRAYCGGFHYKHPSDDFCYMETHVRLKSQQYRPYIDHILSVTEGWDVLTLSKTMRL